jgi:hypothetical protein
MLPSQLRSISSNLITTTIILITDHDLSISLRRMLSSWVALVSHDMGLASSLVVVIPALS